MSSKTKLWGERCKKYLVVKWLMLSFFNPLQKYFLNSKKKPSSKHYSNNNLLQFIASQNKSTIITQSKIHNQYNNSLLS